MKTILLQWFRSSALKYYRILIKWQNIQKINSVTAAERHRVIHLAELWLLLIRHCLLLYSILRGKKAEQEAARPLKLHLNQSNNPSQLPLYKNKTNEKINLVRDEEKARPSEQDEVAGQEVMYHPISVLG